MKKLIYIDYYIERKINFLIIVALFLGGGCGTTPPDVVESNGVVEEYADVYSLTESESNIENDDRLNKIVIENEMKEVVPAKEALELNLSKEVYFLYDQEIDNYPVYKDFIEGRCKTKGLHEEYWLESWMFNQEPVFDRVSFFLFDFDSDNRNELGMIIGDKLFLELYVILEEENDILLGETGMILISGSKTETVQFGDDSLFYEEDEDSLVVTKIVDSGGVLTTFLYSEFKYEKDNILYESIVLFSEDEEKEIVARVVNGNLEFSSKEDQMIYDSMQMIVAQKKAEVELIPKVDFQKYFPIEENNAQKTKLGDILQ